MVRIHPDPPERNLARVASQSRREASTCTKAYTRRRATKSGEAKGAVAQLGERLLCKQEVIGSIPFSSTISIGCRQPSTFVVGKSVTSVESCSVL